MEKLYSWAISFLICSFIVLTVSYLFPRGNVKNTATVVLVMFCMISIIGPLKDINKLKFTITEEQSNTNELTYDSATLGFKTQLRILTDEALKNTGINNYELYIDVSSEKNEIVIKEFKVLIEESEMTEKAKKAIADKTGIEPEVDVFE